MRVPQNNISHEVKMNTLCLLPLLLWCAAAIAGEPAGLTLDQAINPKRIVSARLSPDGKHIAAIGVTGENRGLILINTDTGASRLLVSGTEAWDKSWFRDKEPRFAMWVSNDMIAVDYGYTSQSIDLNGRFVKYVGDGLIGKAEPGNPDSPLLIVYTERDHSELGSVNARTGEFKRFRLPMSGKPVHWAFDKRGNLRAVTVRNSAFWRDVTTMSNWYKRADGEWEKLAEFKMTEPYWLPLQASDDEGKLVISSNVGRDTTAVYAYDTRTRLIGDMMAGHPTVDLAVDGIDLEAPRSVVTLGLKPQRVWLDAEWQSIQDGIDAALPGNINVLSGNPAGRVLVYSYSDVNPGVWYIFDRAAGTLRPVAMHNAQVDAARMRPMEAITYPARDGLTIPAYLTRPAGKSGPQPMVVMIHGGPAVRDHWGWDTGPQLLAAHGYAVFQPQFRGSTGFGRTFAEAGFGQWGLAMQDDITDGVNHLVRQGIADPRRICIYGASYGGYAALWGLVKTPELYRCGVSFAGVVDLEYMFSDNSDVNDSKLGREFSRLTIGDPKRSKEQFAAVSPLKQAHRIQAPLLLMHGAEDRRVPIAHSKLLMKELTLHGKPFEWHEFEQEGHGLGLVRNERIYYEKLIKFLDQHIGDKPAAGTEEAK